jgi:hypothetical protein
MTDEPREDRRQQPKPPKAQFLSAQTAAKKLGIYLQAAPAEFQQAQHSRDELAALQADPPAWLRTLRAEGPHPRSEVAHRLGVTNSAFARAGVADAMTTSEIQALIANPPQWLHDERSRARKAAGA